MEKITQGTEEWLRARAGSLGASQIAEVAAKTKSGYAASRKNIMAQLVVEELTGEPSSGYVSTAMQWGTDTEPMARALYAFIEDVDVTEIGLVRHPEIPKTHASPDGLVGDSGLVEIKCPNSATHIDFLLTGKVAKKYITQMQWQLECTGRDWCDFVMFDPRMPDHLQMKASRVYRDNDMIADLKSEVRKFNEEREKMLESLKKMESA